MASANLTMGINGVDKTGAAFNSVKWKAKATGLSIKNALGGALAFAGAYFGFSKIKEGISELGHLSDIAMKTSTSVDELTKTATALNVLGIQNMGVDQLAKSFDYMQKTTGRTGMSGFLETIGELGKITDTSERAQAAMKIFGRSGMEFMPLINAANTSTEALTNVINAMPQVPQAAAEAGDDAADAMKIIAEGAHSIWLQGIGAIVGLFSQNFEGGIRQAAAGAAAWMEYYAKVSVLAWKTVPIRIKSWIDSTAGAIGGFFSSAFQLKNPFKGAAEAWKYWQDFADMKTEEIMKPAEVWAEQYATKRLAVEKMKVTVKKAAISTAERVKLDGVDDSSIGPSKPTVKNDLIMAGSNEARKLQILGPQLQSETKKQTGLLQKIADNTKSTADNTEHDADNPQGVID